FSLRGARFEQPRVVDLPGATGALVTFAVRPAAPFATAWHTMLMRPSAGGWQLAGDGRAAIVTLRHAAVLLAAPLPPAQLRALPGAHCALAAAALGGEACAIAGGSGGLPEGTLDLGESGESLFGVLGLFRAASGDTGTRLSAAATHSRLLGAPSAAVRRYLLFEVDSRAVDARVARVRVSGGPLPAGGVVLLPPPLTVNGPAFEDWMLQSDPDSGWPAVPWGWCGAETDAGTCSAQWTALRAGSLLRFELLDEAGALIETIEAALPPEPPQPPALLAEVAQRFARLEAADPTAAPGYAQVLGYGSLTSSTTLSWRPPSGASSVELQRAWQQADPTGSGGVETQRSRSLLMPATPAPIVNTFVPRAGWRSTWWSVRLAATDAEGMRHVHALSPANPH
ncbi:MAG TPA: hypothetical protein VK439_11135, partial [Rubrivivax sp.]|nr:hypothetical protein [Rubrivivax sp.]